MPALSFAERDYIGEGVSANVRADGRTREEWREVSVEISPIVQAAGSARVRIGGTDVLVSIKGDVLAPSFEHPEEGQLHCSVDSASTMRLGKSSSSEDRHLQERQHELEAFMNELIGQSIDLKRFCLETGRYCWVLHLDALLLAEDGSVIEALGLACRLALGALRLPKVVISSEGELSLGAADEERVVSSDSVPLLIGVSLLGSGFVIDASGAEESCADLIMYIGINRANEICMTRKVGTGLLDLAHLPQIINAAKEAASSLLKHIS